MKHSFRGAFDGAKVLVTGHSGFKGSWLSLWLREMGAHVSGYGLDPSDESNFRLCGLGPDRGIASSPSGEMRDAGALKESVCKAKPDLVLHLAAQPIVGLSYKEPKLTFDVNCGGTVNLLEAVRQCSSVKAVVVVTTDKVYENKEWLWGYRENDGLGGYDPYSASKAMAELAVRSYQQSWAKLSPARQRVAIATARAGNVIGGGDFGAFRLLPDCMKSCLKGQPMILRNPLSARPWQFVLEALGGYLTLAAALLGKHKGSGSGYVGAWNFGPLERCPVTCAQVADHAAKVWGIKGRAWQLAEGFQAFHETDILRLNWDKAATRLDWAPVYTWQEAVSETAKWFKEYQRQLEKKSARVDMYGPCAAQIKAYTAKAAKQGLWWATEGS